MHIEVSSTAGPCHIAPKHQLPVSSDTGTWDYGFFGTLSDAVVHDIGLTEASVYAGIQVARTRGHATNTQIYNTYVTGDVVGIQAVGGLVGLADGGSTISRSFSTASVMTQGINEPTVVGGLLAISGRADLGLLRDGPRYRNQTVGGLVGQAEKVDGAGPTRSSNLIACSCKREQNGGRPRRRQLHVEIAEIICDRAVTGPLMSGGIAGYNYNGTITSTFWDTGRPIRPMPLARVPPPPTRQGHHSPDARWL